MAKLLLILCLLISPMLHAGDGTWLDDWVPSEDFLIDPYPTWAPTGFGGEAVYDPLLTPIPYIEYYECLDEVSDEAYCSAMSGFTPVETPEPSPTNAPNPNPMSP